MASNVSQQPPTNHTAPSGTQNAVFRSDANILTIPDNILEIIVMQDHNRDYRCWERPYAYRHTRQLSTTCRRFRKILLPVIYHSVFLIGSRKATEAFLDLMPVYGSFCHQLAIRLPGRGVEFCSLADAMRRQRKNLSNLEVLELVIQLNGDSVTGESPSSQLQSWSTDILRKPCALTMVDQELRSWKALANALDGVKELRLHGFTLADAANGFQGAVLSSVRDLFMQLAAPKTFQTSTAKQLRTAFPNVVGITLPAAWCPNPAWIRHAFSGWQLQRINVGHVTDSWPSSTHGADDHAPHQGSSCKWAESLQVLLELHSSSLTSLALSTPMCAELDLANMVFPHLTSLTLRYIEFDDETVETHLKPFLPSPLQQLHIDDCSGLPESFSTWLDPALGRWPNLKTLSLKGIHTQQGPGDDLWEEADEEEREGWDHDDGEGWQSQSRIALEGYCDQRGVEFDGNDWEWFEGFG
ncbi:hypothetical protein FIBSPDRAFT_926419 [Athelia psychrophila]|uniref:F-box domain-containing protein n=1 Tax=Athelia psychrophila TaxID=1759441 RepID=A0A166TG16_9AGAM|nr:hypothetical protein FIBSPDRAFT_926419 [Fibularhizoctonia sp. CBS 109695]